MRPDLRVLRTYDVTEDEPTVELELLPPVADPAQADFAERLVRRMLGLFDNPRTRTRMLRLVGSSFSSARGGRRLYRVLEVAVVNPVARRCGVHASALKLEVVLAQLVGLAVMRYVIQVEPLASASEEEVVALVAPGLRATLGAARSRD